MPTGRAKQHQLASVLRLTYSAGIYLFKVNNGNIKKRCEICSKLTIKTPNQIQWLWTNLQDIFKVSEVVLVFSMLTLNRFDKLFWCFHCWFWTGKCVLGSNFSKERELCGTNSVLQVFVKWYHESFFSLVKLLSQMNNLSFFNHLSSSSHVGETTLLRIYCW